MDTTIAHTPSTKSYTFEESDDVFEIIDNGVPTHVVGHPSYGRRSSSVTTSQTPFLRRESSRRISEPPIIIAQPETKHNNFTAISFIVVVIVVLAATAGFLFYRLEVRSNDLQRQLSELRADYEALSVNSPLENQSKNAGQLKHTGGADDNDGKCVCSTGELENSIGDPSDEEVHPSDGRGRSSILQCCTQDSKQVKTMIEEVVNEAQKGILARIADGNSSMRRMGYRRSAAFAHVNGKLKTRVKANNIMRGYMTNWMAKPQLINRLFYKHGRIAIEHAGVYFVYSQIYFYQGTEDSQDQQNNTQSSKHEPMLHETCLNGHPVMKSAVPFREFTSKYHGGVFKLERGDKISIRVSSNDYQVNMDPELTFFGVYSLQESDTQLPTTESYTTTKPSQ